MNVFKTDEDGNCWFEENGEPASKWDGTCWTCKYGQQKVYAAHGYIYCNKLRTAAPRQHVRPDKKCALWEAKKNV